MASILKYESWSFSSKLLKDKLSFKSLEELVAVFKTTKDWEFPEWVCDGGRTNG